MSDTNRRSLLARAVALTTMGALAGSALVRSKARAQSAAGTGTDGVRALVFDVFGTVVDWRGSLLRELAAFGRERGIAADWDAFVDDWRKGYQLNVAPLVGHSVIRLWVMGADAQQRAEQFGALVIVLRYCLKYCFRKMKDFFI